MHELMFQAGVKGMSERSELIPRNYIYITRNELASLAHSFYIGFTPARNISSCINNIALFRTTMHPLLYANLFNAKFYTVDYNI